MIGVQDVQFTYLNNLTENNRS